MGQSHAHESPSHKALSTQISAGFHVATTPMIDMKISQLSVNDYTSHEGFDFMSTDSLRDRKPKPPCRTKSKDHGSYQLDARKMMMIARKSRRPTEATIVPPAVSLAPPQQEQQQLEFKVHNPYITPKQHISQNNAKWSYMDSSHHTAPILMNMSSRRLDLSIRSGRSLGDAPPSIPRRFESITAFQ